MSLARGRNKNKGSGLINTLINKLPIELHVPGYQYCGPGTNLKKRLARGDKGINPLDSACREHDIAYEQSNSIADRNKADYILEQRAWDRFKSKDSSLKEKAVAWGVTTAMKAKRKIGGGCGFKAVLKATKKVLKKNVGEKNLMKLTKKCVAVARKTFKTKKTKVPRTITIPKKGGVLPLIPIFAGLSALGALTGGVANVVKVANEFNRNTPSHLGKGLYLTPYKGNSYKIETPQKSGFRNLINNNEYVIIPTGTYELDQLEFIIQKMMPDFVSFFELKANSRTLKCMISCSHDVDLGVENSIAKLLGFRNVLYTTGATHESENIVNIMKINCIKVECNLITGSFCDGAPNQTIHELYPTVPAGYKTVEVPRHPVFYGLNTRSISRVVIVLKDQDDCLINLRAYCSYTPNDLNALENSAWDSAMDSEDNKNFMSNNVFTGCIPLKHNFGFCEDCKKILLNYNQQLILNRASTDFDAIHVVGEGATAAIEKNKKITVELTKVLWKMPIIKVSDKEKLRLLKVIDSCKTLLCAFRTCDLCEYPVLPRNTSYSWTVKSSSLL
ncbi:hypothetical protein QTP88_006719 [Uroleucon formosanum]